MEKVEFYYCKYGILLYIFLILFVGFVIGKDERKENRKGKELVRVGEELESFGSLVLFFCECMC